MSCNRCKGAGRICTWCGREPVTDCKCSGEVHTQLCPNCNTPMAMPMPVPRNTTCFRCDGSGKICNRCGEASGACECGDFALEMCAECKGTGE
jgi:hypothetical protein